MRVIHVDHVNVEITWSWWHNFFSSSRVQAYIYVKGCAICQAKGFHFAVKPPACGCRGSTGVLNSLTSFKSFDVIEVSGLLLMTSWMLYFRSTSVCLILVAPWKVKVLMWPTCLSWKMVWLTCRWDKIYFISLYVKILSRNLRYCGL